LRRGCSIACVIKLRSTSSKFMPSAGSLNAPCAPEARAVASPKYHIALRNLVEKQCLSIRDLNWTNVARPISRGTTRPPSHVLRSGAPAPYSHESMGRCGSFLLRALLSWRARSSRFGPARQLRLRENNNAYPLLSYRLIWSPRLRFRLASSHSLRPGQGWIQ